MKYSMNTVANPPVTQSPRRNAFARFALLAFMVSACSQPLKFTNDDSKTVLAYQTITAANPSQPGSFKVLRIDRKSVV